MGTKSDTKIAPPITFQPMPKRLMVWDKEKRKFITHDDNFCFARDDNNELCLCDIDWYAMDLVEVDPSRYIVVQSTNLFDRDGKEIFEGSILEEDLTHLRAGRKYHFIVQYVNAKFTTKPIDGAEFRPAMLPNTTKALRNIGHILSNPELVEGK